MHASATHLIIVPSFNSGALLEKTVREAVGQWNPVWVVIDGSTDGSEIPIEIMCASTPELRLIRSAENRGKGAAVLTAALAALDEGFSHALVMDADCQHPPEMIRAFLETSAANPEHLVLGLPVFGPEAPQLRLQGRKISVGLVQLETLGRAVQDPLFGFRVYPLRPLVEVMRHTSGGRHYDFDPEVAVRLVWRGVPTLNLPAACRYIPQSSGGISHFHYFRDNVRMVWLHTRLLVELLIWRWWSVWRQRRRRLSAAPSR